MPIYEYECLACNHRFESIRKMSHYAPDCPVCRSTLILQVVSATTFVLKGVGWAKDGYGGKG